MKASRRFIKAVSLAIVSIGGVFQSQTSWTMGKSAPSPSPSPSQAGPTVPNPLRYTVIDDFQGVQPLSTPNGVTTTVAQVQPDLQASMVAALGNGTLQAMDAGTVSSLEGCGTHLELRSTLTEFDMNSTQLNETFGFNTGGVIAIDPTLPKATESDTLTIGHIQMTFTLYECPNSGSGDCEATPISAQADQTVLGNNLQVTVNWSNFNVSLGLQNFAGLMPKLQAIMEAAAQQLESNSAFSSLPWQTTVTAIDSGNMVIGAGLNQDLKPTDYFTVYETSSSSVNLCSGLTPLGCASPVSGQVLPTETVLQIFKSFSSDKPQPGDVVMVGDPSACYGQ